MTKKAYLVVRSVVPEEDRAGFDHWYQTDHMPKAIRMFGAEAGWRFWSRTDPSIHCAVYRYPSAAFVENRSKDDNLAMRREYEETWPRVTRTREIFELAGEVPAI